MRMCRPCELRWLSISSDPPSPCVRSGRTMFDPEAVHRLLLGACRLVAAGVIHPSGARTRRRVNLPANRTLLTQPRRRGVLVRRPPPAATGLRRGVGDQPDDDGDVVVAAAAIGELDQGRRQPAVLAI